MLRPETDVHRDSAGHYWLHLVDGSKAGGLTQAADIECDLELLRGLYTALGVFLRAKANEDLGLGTRGAEMGMTIDVALAYAAPAELPTVRVMGTVPDELRRLLGRGN